MTRYVGVEPWHGGDDVVAVDVEDGHHGLRGSYDFVRLEVDRDRITLRSRGREGDSTQLRSLFVAEVGESVSTFDTSLHHLQTVVSTAVVEARYDRSG